MRTKPNHRTSSVPYPQEALNRSVARLREESRMAKLVFSSPDSSASYLLPSAESGNYLFVVWGADHTPLLSAPRLYLPQSRTAFLHLTRELVEGEWWKAFEALFLDYKPSLLVTMGRVDFRSELEGEKSRRWWHFFTKERPSSQERKIVHLREVLLGNERLAARIREYSAEFGVPVIEAVYDVNANLVSWDISREVSES